MRLSKGEIAKWRRQKRRSQEEFWRRYARAKGISLGEVYRRIRATSKGA